MLRCVCITHTVFTRGYLLELPDPVYQKIALLPHAGGMLTQRHNAPETLLYEPLYCTTLNFNISISLRAISVQEFCLASTEDKKLSGV